MNFVNMTLKKKVSILKNLNKMSQMTLNDPKFDFKNSLDTLHKEYKWFFYYLCQDSMSSVKISA